MDPHSRGYAGVVRTNLRSTLGLTARFLVALAVACGGGAPAAVSTEATPAAEGAVTSQAPSAPSRAEPVASEFAFPTGSAVTIAAGYESPGDIIDSTGAYLPANGKPTLVYTDAIW